MSNSTASMVLDGLDEWCAGAQSWQLLYGIAADSRLPLAESIHRTMESHAVSSLLVHGLATEAFGTFSAARKVISWIVEIVEEEEPTLLEEFRHGLEAIFPSTQEGQQPIRATRIAETIIFAITRRISRESHHSAVEIDALARFTLEAHRRCPSLKGGLLLIVADLEYWDRPSLRWLVRVGRLAKTSDQIDVFAFASIPQVSDENSLEEKILTEHGRFLERAVDTIFTRVTVGEESSRLVPTSELLSDHGTSFSHDDAFLEVGSALGYQNYERVFLICLRLLRDVRNDEEEAKVRRLIGVAYAQVGALEAADMELSLAIRLTKHLPFKAHLEYLLGLLATKRFYRLDEAEKHYARGEQLLKARDEATAEDKVERAWLMNGQALILTLEAKQVSGADCERLYRESLSMEMEAYGLVKNLKTPAASYLRHNLLANITFLLEISKRYEEATRFWKRTFERYLAVDNPGFAVAFDSRLGMLLAHCGRYAEGLEAMERARLKSQHLMDLFYEERICLALGYIAHRASNSERALSAFRDGARLALKLATYQSYREHISGILWCLAELGAVREFGVALDELASVPATRDFVLQIKECFLKSRSPLEALKKLEVSVPIPSPKMPAYISEVDLEGGPAQDLNRYLVSEGGPLTLRSVTK